MAGLNVTVAVATLAAFVAMFLAKLMANRQQIRKLQKAKAVSSYSYTRLSIID
jgi:hypothetical protein